MVSDHPTTPPKKALKQNFTGSKKILQIAYRFFFETKKTQQKTPGKDLEKPTTKDNNNGEGSTSRGQKTQRVPTVGKPPNGTEAHPGKLHGSLLGRDASLLAWHLVLGLSSFDAASAVPWGKFLGVFFCFFLGGKGENLISQPKNQSNQYVLDVDTKKGGNLRDVNILGGFMSVWLMVFTTVYCFGPFFPPAHIRCNISEETPRSFETY